MSQRTAVVWRDPKTNKMLCRLFDDEVPQAFLSWLARVGAYESATAADVIEDEDLPTRIAKGTAGGSLVRVKATRDVGRVIRTPGSGVLVRMGSEPVTWGGAAGDVRRFDVDELELVEAYDEPG